jgi:hypothetical protein
MSLSTILIIAGLLGAALGVKKPWIGGLTGFLIGPSLFYISISSNIVPLFKITCPGG